MPEVDLGNVMGPQGVPGSQWYYGTKITGTSTTGTVFSSSGISSARVNDKYLNTSTGNIYNCTTAGAASVAKWAYIGNIKGPQGNMGPIGPTGQVDFTTPITFDVAQSRANLESGDSIATLFGKTQKWFDDINSGGASTLLATNLSENRALISNSSGKIAVSTITSTELGYLDGVTSNIQGQIGTLSSLDTSAKGSLVSAVNELNGKIDWKLYEGTNCTVYYADNVGMGVRVIASGLTLQPGSVNSNVVATLPSQAAFFGSLALPCSLMSSNWVSVSQNCTLSFSNATKEIRARISGNASVSDAVINGFFFFPPALAYAG